MKLNTALENMLLNLACRNVILKVPNTSTDNDFYHLNNCYNKIKSQSLCHITDQ